SVKRLEKTPMFWSSCLLAYCYGVWFIHLPAYVRSHHNIAKALHNAYEVSQMCISLYTVLCL
ncbi:Hypothetical predicted protein, partial [Paramuricea clavata]